MLKAQIINGEVVYSMFFTRLNTSMVFKTEEDHFENTFNSIKAKVTKVSSPTARNEIFGAFAN